MCYFYGKILYLLTVYFFARFTAFARFMVERNLIVIETTVSIFTQKESILRG